MTTTDDAVRAAAEEIMESACYCTASTSDYTKCDVCGAADIIRTTLADALEDGERLDWLFREAYVVEFDNREELDATRKGDTDG